MSPLVLAGLFAASAASAGLACWLLIRALKPHLARIAAARPDARSTHMISTPQGAGVAVMMATIACTQGGTFAFGGPDAGFAWLAAALVLLTVLGFLDDMIGMAWLPKLALQALACMLALGSLPDTFQVIHVTGLFWLSGL